MRLWKILKEDTYKAAAITTANALRDEVIMGGTVLHVSPDAGFLRQIDDYFQVTGETDDNHGTPAIIYGMLAEIVLTD